MRILLGTCAVAAAFWLSCAHPPDKTHPSGAPSTAATQAPARPPDTLEILLQRGHGRPIRAMRTFREGEHRYALSLGDDLRAWEVIGSTPEPRWKLKRVWKNFEYVWWLGHDNDEYFLIERLSGAELYRVTRPGELLLGSPEGIPPRLASVHNLTPEDPTTRWRGFAVQDEDDSNRDGTVAEWHLFFAPDGDHWSRLQLPGVPPKLGGFLRLGPGQIALRDREDSDRDGQHDEWHLAAYDGARWSALALPHAFEQISGIVSSEDTRWARLDEANDADHDGRAGEQEWYFRRDDTTWVPLTEALPSAPRDFTELKTFGERHLVQLTVPTTNAQAKAGHSEQRFWVYEEQRGFVPLHDVLPLGSLEVDAAIGFAGSQGVAVRVLLGDGATLQPGQWLLFLRQGDGGWRPLAEVLSSAPTHAWAVASFGGDEGFGVQEMGDPNGDGTSYVWSWFVRDAQKGWVPLSERVQGLPRRVAAVISSSLEQGLKVQDALDSDGDGQTSEWQWYLPGPDARLRPLNEVIPSAPRDIQNVEHKGLHGLLSIKTLSGDTRWFAPDSQGRWMNLEGIITAPAPPRDVTAQLPARIQAVDEEPGLALTLHPLRDDEQLAPRRRLLRERGDKWRPLEKFLPSLPSGSLEVRALLGGGGIEVRGSAQPDQTRSFYLATPEGRFIPAPERVPSWPRRAQAAYSFLGGRAFAVQEEGDSDEDRRFGEWSYFYQEDSGTFRPLHELLPGAPAAVQVALPIGDGTGVALLEEADADGDGKPGTWFYFLRTPQGRFVPLRSAVPAAPSKIWQVSAFAEERGLALQEEADANGDGKPFTWYYFYQEPDGSWRELLTQLPGAPREPDTVKSFWGGSGVALRSPARAETAASWSFFHQGMQGWQKLASPSGGSWRDVAGVKSWGLLALQELGDPDRDGRENTWRLFQARDGATLVPLELEGESAFAEVRFFESSQRLAVARRPTAPGAPLRWHWYTRTTPHTYQPSGHTGTPDWVGFSSEALSDGTLRFDKAIHVLDGHPAESVPQPSLWFHAQPSLAGEGKVLLAPDLVPEEMDFYSPGVKGGLLVYKVKGNRLAVAFTKGTLELSTREVRLGTDQVKAMPVILNHFSDGTTRIHLLEDPTRWISVYEDPQLGSVYFDDRGYFYSTRSQLTHVMTFRNKDEVYTFAQMSAYLFRPDKLEERLNLPDNSLFELTESDRKAIQRARELSRDGTVDLTRLRPPKLELGEVPTEIEEGTVKIPFRAVGHAGNSLDVSMRVLGVGQERGDGNRTQADAKPGTDGTFEVRGSSPVSLVPGLNVIEVTATDSLELTDTVQVSVNYKARQKAPQDLWVALVTASDYQGRLKKLPLTRHDARTVREAFQAQQGKAYRNVKVLSLCESTLEDEKSAGKTQPPACDGKPDLSTITQRLPDFFAQMQPGDTAVLYVSGHGLKIRGRYYFVPPEARADDPAGMVSWEALRSILTSNRKLGRKLVILDTCHSGAVAGDDREKNRIVQQAAELEGIYILSASAADASAFEVTDLDNGIFTYALKHALVGDADLTPEDGTIAFEELAHYVGRTVRELSSTRRIRQEPHVPFLDARLDFAVATVERVRLKLYLDVIRPKEGPLGINQPAALAAWEKELQKQEIPGLRMVERSRMTHHLVIEESGDRVRVTLQRIGDKKTLLERKRTTRAHAAKLISETLKAEK